MIELITEFFFIINLLILCKHLQEILYTIYKISKQKILVNIIVDLCLMMIVLIVMVKMICNVEI